MIKKKPIKLYNLICSLSKHGLKMPVLANTLFRPQFSFSQHFEQCSCSLLRFFCMTHSSWWYLSNSCMFLYCKLEQCSAINNLSIASALLLSKSDLCNLKFCVTFVGMQKLLYSYLSSFATSYAFYAHIVSLWLHYCKLRNRLFLNYRLFSRMGSRTIGTEPTCKFWILQSYMSKLLAALVYQEVFYQILLLTSITEPLGNIVPWDKNIFYQCCL